VRVELIEDESDRVRVHGPSIDGVEPLEAAPGVDGFNNNYLGLDLPVDYDGGLIVGRGYEERHHGDLELITLWKYREVIELRFERSRLADLRDLSVSVTPIRQVADHRAALVGAFFRDCGQAMRKASGEQARRAIRNEYFDEESRALLDADMDEIARGRLSGLIDPAYLGG